METAIGVFASRDRAEEAVRELLEQRVPQDSIVFLTRSESEALSLGKELGAYAGGFVGGAVGMTSGVVAATLLVIPGIGQVFALGVGATALLGLIGAGTGSALGKAMSQSGSPQPTADEKSSEDLELFRRVLKDGRSLVIVRTESPDVADIASGILNRLGIGTQAQASATPTRVQTTSREVGGITVVDMRGRITIGEGSVKLRELVGELIGRGKKRILLNMQEVDFVDSRGIGELVKTHMTLRREGGQLKLVNLNQKVQELMKITSLTSVFDIQKDEDSAIKSFGPATARAGA
jgi:anti-sigma B factor antagonist